MDIKNIIIPLGLLFLIRQLSSTFSNKIKVDKVSFSNVRIDFKSVSLRGNVVLTISNHLPTTIPFEGFNGKIYSSGTDIANIQTSKNQDILQGTNLVSFDFEAPLNAAVDLVGKLINKGYTGVKIRGDVLARGLVIPIDQQVNIL